MIDDELRAAAKAQFRKMSTEAYVIQPHCEGDMTVILLVMPGARAMKFRAEQRTLVEAIRNAMALSYEATLMLAFERTWGFKAQVVEAVNLLKAGNHEAATEVLEKLLIPHP